MPTRNYSVSFGGGVPIARSQVRTADGGSDIEVDVPHGFPGTLTTRGGDAAGTITLEEGHGIETADNVDIFWDGGVQYDVTANTVSINSMPFDSGVGDNLPAENTVVVVSKRVEINLLVDGDSLNVLAIQQKFAQQNATPMSHIDLQDDGGGEVAELDLHPNGVQVFDVGGGSANPFTGNTITKAFVANGSPTQDAKLLASWLQDVTPE